MPAGRCLGRGASEPRGGRPPNRSWQCAPVVPRIIGRRAVLGGVTAALDSGPGRTPILTTERATQANSLVEARNASSHALGRARRLARDEAELVPPGCVVQATIMLEQDLSRAIDLWIWILACFFLKKKKQMKLNCNDDNFLKWWESILNFNRILWYMHYKSEPPWCK